MNNTVTVTKKGRMPIFGDAMSSAQRQNRARSLAMKHLCDNKVTAISTSGLIALLPKLISNSHKKLVKEICNEIIARVEK